MTDKDAATILNQLHILNRRVGRINATVHGNGNARDSVISRLARVETRLDEHYKNTDRFWKIFGVIAAGIAAVTGTLSVVNTCI